ncbi:hypothetical protein E2C01_005517 [Portunus trituberculatus]|uniref:Uncharacterized protein n=1 Tax=Portunus trituberculatus TaxID=210409 RepID=A0A5B7CUK3_PORTR|nr:hypothetical protein [Portunus trituberculatus]
MMESKAFRSLNSSPLTDCLQPLSHSEMLHLLLSSAAIFMLTGLLILLTAYLSLICSLAAQCFLLLVPTLSTFLMQELTSTLSHSYLTLVNSGTPNLFLYSNFTSFKKVLRHLSLSLVNSRGPARWLVNKCAFFFFSFILLLASFPL